MKQLSRRIILLLALPAMLAVGAQDALAQQEGVSYYYHEWDYDALQGKNRVSNYGRSCTNYKVLDASTSLSASGDFGVGDNREWDNGGYKWVVVKGNVTINTLSVIGEGHLILTDGCKLTCTGGVWLSGSSSLNIYSQSSGENEGQLIVTQSNKGCAGIGSWKQEEANGSPVSMGSLTIHGGHIEATGAQYGAGIGGGEDRGIQSGCSYTQYGGDVRAIGGEYAAGLGGGYAGHQGGDVTIYGGKIYAQSGAEGAGIGGGSPSHGGGAGGRVTIWGGIVEARNAGIEKYGAGIGGGYESAGGEINIHGGEVNVESYKLPEKAYKFQAGAAIGNGGSIINITGGKIRAISIGLAAGIGYDGYRSSWNSSLISSSCQVNISGGTIEARNPGEGAGISAGPEGKIIISGSADIQAYSGQKNYDHSSAAIGGAENSAYGYIEINGGTVYAESSGVGAGIGGGYKSTGGTIVINGGNITAKGGVDYDYRNKNDESPEASAFTSAGIGGGGCGNGGKIFINGGTVYAQGGNIDKVEYYGNTFSGSSAAGIGGGSILPRGTSADVDAGAGADVKITGGTVIAIGGIDKDAAAIGHSYNWAIKDISYYEGTLSIYDGAKVTSGASENVALVTAVANRVSACHNKAYAKIEPCDHAAFGNYTYINDNLHTAHCLYCAYSKEQAHEYTDGKCACGKKKEVKPETVSITLYRAKDATSGKYDNGLLLHVVKGEKYTITTCNAPEGLTFMGWMKDPSEAPADYEMRDGDFMKLVDAGKELTTEGDITTINLYARYRYRYTDEWTWSDDWSSATVTIKLGDQTIVENQVAKISDNSLAPTAENPNGTFGKSATYAWKKGNDIVYNFGDAVSRPVSLALTLSDDEDNSALLEQAVGTTYETVTLSGRTLYKDGSWNTLCLPFAVTTASGPLSGDGVVAQVLDAEKSSLSDDGKLALTFKDAPATIPAGLPFVIKWNAEGSDIVSPTFNDVTITTPQPASADFRGGSFVGQFSPFQITSGNLNAIVLLTDDNTLGYSKSTRTLRSCRAHFEVLREMTSGARLMTGYSIIFGPSAEADPTAVRSVTVGGGDNDGWYTLGGQRLSSRPTRQGIYVRQGRKVVIKQ